MIQRAVKNQYFLLLTCPSKLHLASRLTPTFCNLANAPWRPTY
jgi:hypothetical protein